jgi:hypothetical protein
VFRHRWLCPGYFGKDSVTINPGNMSPAGGTWITAPSGEPLGGNRPDVQGSGVKAQQGTELGLSRAGILGIYPGNFTFAAFCAMGVRAGSRVTPGLAVIALRRRAAMDWELHASVLPLS